MIIKEFRCFNQHCMKYLNENVPEEIQVAFREIADIIAQYDDLVTGTADNNLNESILYLSSNWSAMMSPKEQPNRPMISKIKIPPLDLQKVHDMPLSPEIDIAP